MGQGKWAYRADNGKLYNIGLFHGERTGHLMVYVNAKIVLIEFNVKETNVFPLFLEDELFEIKITREPKQFVYAFEINEEAQTARNISKKQVEQKNWTYILLFVGGFFAIVLAFTIFMNSGGNKGKAISNFDENIYTTTKVFIKKESGSTLVLRYAYIVNNKIYRDKISCPKILPSGNRVENGDEFIVYYSVGDPSVSRIDFTKALE